jgi:hypothetical protein
LISANLSCHLNRLAQRANPTAYVFMAWRSGNSGGAGLES